MAEIFRQARFAGHDRQGGLRGRGPGRRASLARQALPHAGGQRRRLAPGRGRRGEGARAADPPLGRIDRRSRALPLGRGHRRTRPPAVVRQPRLGPPRHERRRRRRIRPSLPHRRGRAARLPQPGRRRRQRPPPGRVPQRPRRIPNGAARGPRTAAPSPTASSTFRWATRSRRRDTSRASWSSSGPSMPSIRPPGSCPRSRRKRSSRWPVRSWPSSPPTITSPISTASTRTSGRSKAGSRPPRMRDRLRDGRHRVEHRCRRLGPRPGQAQQPSLRPLRSPVPQPPPPAFRICRPGLPLEHDQQLQRRDDPDERGRALPDAGFSRPWRCTGDIRGPSPCGWPRTCPPRSTRRPAPRRTGPA